MSESAKILLVDDEVAHLKTLERLFLKEGYQVFCARSGEEALDIVRTQPLHLVLTDLKMGALDGMDLLKLVKTLQPDAEVILMTAFGTVERAVEGIKQGAYDFVSKPIKRATILKSVHQGLERQALMAENRQLKAQLADLTGEQNLVGQSASFRAALAVVKQVAASATTVLLTGESGTGKELFARMLHQLSDRADKPFVALNCAALPETILESELFGYEKGAFTGATQRKIGRFEAADGGTLFLDEIGELSPQVQVRLLRVLQESAFERLGSNTPTRVDVRIIAATHRDIEDELEAGNFREDLYYRLNVVNIEIPPLRRRADDIPLLAQHFLNQYRQKNKRAIDRLSPACIDALLAYKWPGNVRELENVMERAVVLDRDGVIDLDDLPEHITSFEPDARHITIPLGTTLEEIEKRVLEETLKLTGGDKKLAAKLLDISTRTIYRKV